MARGQGKKTTVSVPAKAPVPAKVPMKTQTNDVVLAMDIGTRSIIGMVGVVEDNKVNIIAVEKEEHTERAMIDGQIENIEKVASIAKKVKKGLETKSNIKLERVCVAAAGRALRTKRADYELELPGTQLIDDEIISRLEAGAITRAEEAFDAENEAADDSRRYYLVGYTVCQYFLDQYMISNLKDHRGRQIKVDLIATFLPSEVVESLYTTMNKIGLEVASMTLEPIAAINAAIPENIRLLNLVLVDIGAGTSDIAACTGGSVTGYTMATMAGDEITETIMKRYLVDFSTAESVKAQLEHQDEISFANILGFEQKFSKADICKCIQGAKETLSKEIADKVVEINGTAPSALFLAGGGSKLAGLKEAITEALGMEDSRVAIAGNYFQTSAYSEEYDLNNPEYATPLGIAVSSGLNMINDSFRVILNNRPAKLFRSGTFTALNLLMMNGYNFRDIMGRTGANLTVTVNGRRKVFYGTASEPASLFINQKEGKLSDVIHAGDNIEFIPAVHGTPARAYLGDIEGAKASDDVTVNGMRASLKTALKNGDVIFIRMPEKETVKEQEQPKVPDGEAVNGQEETGSQALGKDTENVKEEETDGKEKEETRFPQETALGTETAGEEPAEGSAFARLGQFGGKVMPMKHEPPAGEEPAILEEPGLPEEQTLSEEPVRAEEPISAEQPVRAEESTAEEEPGEAEEAAEKPAEEKPMIMFHFNGSPLRLPRKEDGRPYYLMDLIQYSGIDLDHPKGTVALRVNGEEGRFQQVLRAGDNITITEEQR